MRRIAFPLLLVVLFAYSCKLGKNYKGTELVMPEAFAQADTSLPSVPVDTVNTDTLEKPEISDLFWWTIFDDPVLDTLVREALVNNRNARIAAENILQARYALNIQNANFLPKFDVTAQASRGNFQLNNIGDESNLFLGTGSLYWELDFWGKLRRQSEAARADLLASEYGYRSLMISLISDVVSSYFVLQQNRAELEISKHNLALRDSMLIIINARYEKGIIPKIDVNQAQIQQAIAAGRVPIYTRRVAQVEHALSVLIGRNPGRIETGKSLEEQKFDVELPQQNPINLLEHRPDVLAAEYALIAQNARVGAAQANRLPSISVTGLLGVASNDINQISLSNPLWNLGGQLVGPLFYWGQLKRRADIEISKRYQSLAAYENTVLNALREVEDALVEIRTAREEVAISEGRVEAALSAQDLSKQRYSQGVTSYLEFLESQRQAFDAELLLAGNRAALLTAYIKLYKALGGGWLSEEEKKAASEQQ